MNHLRIHRDVQRGDIVVLEDHLDDSQLNNNGKMAYNGKHLISWKLYEGRRFLPVEFQAIIEFPIHYWDDAFDNPQ